MKAMKIILLFFAMLMTLDLCAQTAGGEISRQSRSQAKPHQSTRSNGNNRQIGVQTRQRGNRGTYSVYGRQQTYNSAKTFQNQKIETDYHVWEVNSVLTEGNKIIIKKTVYPKVDGSWVCSDKGEFIEDADTGQKFYIENSDIGFKPGVCFIEDTNPRYYYETYPSLPETTKRINISSGSQYYIRNYQIK